LGEGAYLTARFARADMVGDSPARIREQRQVLLGFVLSRTHLCSKRGSRSAPVAD